jgi:glycosyltransferase involved in cell wall biosynthesis
MRASRSVETSVTTPSELEPATPHRGTRLKIALVTSHWGPPWTEGVRNLARRLVEFFQARDAGVAVIAPPIASRGAGAGVLASVRAVFKFLVFAVSAALGARRARADVVLMIASVSPGLGLRTWLLHHATGRPVVLYLTGRRRVVRGYRLLLRAHTVLANAPALAELFGKAEIVPPFTDPRRWVPPRRQAPPERPVILFLGAFEHCRGVEYLIRAMDHLPERLQASLVLAWNGRGWRRAAEILRMIRESSAPGRISLVKGGDVASFYAEAAVVVIPRITPERMAFPLRIVEAMSMALPLVVTTVNGMDRIIEGCGLAVPPRDAGALAAALERLLTDRELYRRSVAGCLERARRFDSAASLEALYRAVERAA